MRLCRRTIIRQSVAEVQLTGMISKEAPSRGFI